VRQIVANGLAESVHDVSDGGLAAALAESAIAGGLGANVDLSSVNADSDDARLFGEGPGGWVVSASHGNVAAIERIVVGTTAIRLGEVRGSRLVAAASDATVDLPVADLSNAFEAGVADRLR
jgi:phosphoribosylformylglycinamidine synthase